MTSAPRAAVFLDRDGVINRNILNPKTGQYESPGLPEDFHLAPGAIPAIRRLHDAGIPLFLISNQPNYAKGKNTLAELAAVHQKLESALHEAGIRFHAFYYCYHHPKGIVPEYSGPCDCRKPSPYFLFKASDEFQISLPHSWIIGDRPSDIECGRNAGLRTIRVKEDHPAHRHPQEPKADYEAADLTEAATLVLANTASSFPGL